SSSTVSASRSRKPRWSGNTRIASGPTKPVSGGGSDTPLRPTDDACHVIVVEERDVEDDRRSREDGQVRGDGNADMQAAANDEAPESRLLEQQQPGNREFGGQRAIGE